MTGRTPSLREQVARAIAEVADDGVFDRDEPDNTSDDEDRDYWLRLADAALAAHAAHATADWREQVTTREAIRSELIRQHLAGECAVTTPASSPSPNAPPPPSRR